LNLCHSLILDENKEWGKYGSDKGKFVTAEKGKRASRRTRIGLDFDPKTSKLCDQEAVDKYLASYSFRWSPEIKFEFCSNDVDVTLALPDKEGVCMDPWCWHLD